MNQEAFTIDEPSEPEIATGAREIFFRLVPAFDALRSYSWRSFGLDTLAGLTVAAVAIPQAMAYALVAGVEPHYGLYTAIVMTAVGALLASSRELINGPTNAISIALLSALAPIATPKEKMEAAVVLALLVGLFQTGITLFRLGDLTRYISHAVIVGFTLGASVLLVLDQLKNLLGIRTPPSVHPGDHFLQRLWQTLVDGQANYPTMAVGLLSILLVLGLRWVNARMHWRLPELLLVVIVMAWLSWHLGLEQQGVGVIAEIPRQLPTFRVPDLQWSQMRNLSNSALAIASLGLLEAIAMSKALAAKSGQKLDMNQQCLSEGLANLAGSFFRCFPGSGSLTRSAINQQAGAVSQWAGFISALGVAATVLTFAPLARYIPLATLAGILLVTAWSMVDRHQLRYHLRATRFDALLVVATAVSAVAISVEFCMLIGVVLSFALYVHRAARIHMAELTVTPERVIRERVPTDPPCGRLLIYNLEGELFFGSAPDLEKHLTAIDRRAQDGIRVVVLRLKRARNPDAVCLALLEAFLLRMEKRQIKVLLCGVRRDFYRVLRNIGIETRLGPNRIFRETLSIWSSTLEAVRHAYELLANDVCETCPRRDEIVGKEGWYYMI
jgi:SulP family sulfate permease